jgi:2-isopropylmalate synthase
MTATSRAQPRRSRARRSARIHTFIATSPLHMEKKLRMTPEQVLEQAKQSVRFARNLVGDIEFSPKTATAATPISCAACWRR